jgi:hypothetical protein
MESGGVDPGQSLKAGGNGRRLRLQQVADPVVIGGDGKTHGNLLGILQDIQIASNQGRARENFDAPAVLPQHIQAASGQAVAGFHGLIGIADAGQESPAGRFFPAQFSPQDIREIDFDFHEAAPGGCGVMAAVAAHENGVALATAVGEAQVGVDDIIHPGNL